MRATVLTILGIIVIVLAFSSAAASQQTAVTIAPPSAAATVSELETRGDELRTQREYAAALQYFKLALKKDKNNSVLYNKAAICEMQLKRYDQARADLNRALKKKKDYAEAENNLGVVFFMQRKYDDAVRHYEKAVKLNEASASFHSNLGAALFSKGDIPRSVAEYTRAIELDPEILARITSGGQTVHVITPAERARFFYEMAKIYAKRNDLDRCFDCLKKAKDENYADLDHVYKDPEFQSVRTDPRLAAVVPQKTQ